jgi:hypothetical protein
MIGQDEEDHLAVAGVLEIILEQIHLARAAIRGCAAPDRAIRSHCFFPPI